MFSVEMSSTTTATEATTTNPNRRKNNLEGDFIQFQSEITTRVFFFHEFTQL